MEATLPESRVFASSAAAIPLGEPERVRNWRLASYEETARRVLILIALYTIPAIVVMRPVDDPDLWWHLRTGKWIAAHGTVPATDPFSSFGHGKPWIAYSWLFDVITFGLYQRMGLPGILFLRVVLVFAVAVSIHRFVAKREPRFLVATGMVGLALLPIGYLMSERPGSSRSSSSR